MATPKDARDLFDNLLPAGLVKHAEAAWQLNAIYGFQIGEDAWTVDCTVNPPICVRGDTGKAQCLVTVGADDFKCVLEDPSVAGKLYFQGKLRVTGDVMRAMLLKDLFKLAAA